MRVYVMLLHDPIQYLESVGKYEDHVVTVDRLKCLGIGKVDKHVTVLLGSCGLSRCTACIGSNVDLPFQNLWSVLSS